MDCVDKGMTLPAIERNIDYLTAYTALNAATVSSFGAMTDELKNYMTNCYLPAIDSRRESIEGSLKRIKIRDAEWNKLYN